MTALRLRARSPEPAGFLLLAGLLVAVPAVAMLAAVRPGTALLGIVGLAVVAVTMARTDIAVLLLIATGPLEQAFNTTGTLSLTKVAGALAFLSFVGYMIRSHGAIVIEPMQAVVLALLAIAVLSASQAAHLSEALTTTTRYTSYVTLYFVISQLPPTAAFQRAVAWTFGSAATVSAVIGLVRFHAGRDNRATLPFSDPNDFAFMLAAALPLVFWLLGSRRKILVPVVVAMIGTILAGIMLSLSRGTLVGLGVGLLFLIVTDRRRLQLTIAAGVIAAVAAVLILHSNGARVHEALVQKQNVASQNVSTRLQAWSAASRLAADKPLLGAGPGNFRFYYDDLVGLVPGTPGLAVAHDAYLDVAAELGIPAILLFLTYLGTSFGRLTISTRRGDGLPGFAQALRISLVVAMAGAVFLSEQYYLPFWLIGGLATALWSQGERRAKEEQLAAETAAA